MDIDQLKKLLTDIQGVPRIEPPEATLFSIGGKGYFENPTTDMLAFFCESNGVHGLDNLVINALFSALPEQPELSDCTVISKPEREIKTSDNKRIDLLLEGSDWVMVLENKIFHNQKNPFKSYEAHIKEKKTFASKLPIFVVLSPGGRAPDGWQGLSYASLLQSLKAELAQAFIDQPLNKWLILLREFILHLEGIMSKPVIPVETVDFVLNHLNELQQAQAIKQQAIEEFQKEIRQFVQQSFPDRTVLTKLEHWHGFPSLRFYLEDWETASSTALFLDGRAGKSFCINYYCFGIEDDQQRQLADNHLKEDDCGKPWDERKGSIRCYKARFKTNEKSEMKDLLVHKLNLLDNFETKIRASWK